MFQNQVSGSYQFIITFKTQYFKIIVGNNKLIKYYDDKILNDELKNKLRDLISDLKEKL